MIRLWKAFLLVVALVVHVSAAQAATERPNVVFVLVDNMGWGEPGSYGGGTLRGAPTPRLDELAAEGLRLQNFNVEVSCTPSRSALLTGRFAIRSGTLRQGYADEVQGLVQWEVTLAEILSARGYATAAYGKWHLGAQDGRYPTDQGFDEWYGIPRTSHEALDRTSPGYDPSVTAPMFVMESRKGQRAHQIEEYGLEQRREIDSELTRRGIRFIRSHARARKPFFLYLSLTQIHYPALPGRAFAGKTGYGDFADAVVETDHHMGEILDAIEGAGISRDTIVIFSSDNGPEWRRPWQGTAGPWRGSYATALEGGIRAPFLIRWPMQIAAGRVSNEIVHVVDILPTIARLTGGAVPGDRPIDGVDQTDFLLGRRKKSHREGFVVYMDGKAIAVKWRDWKQHIFWKENGEGDDELVELSRPYLFNLIRDPKEQTPRTGLEDYWVYGPIRKLLAEMQASLEKHPPIPFGAPDPWVADKP